MFFLMRNCDSKLVSKSMFMHPRYADFFQMTYFHTRKYVCLSIATLRKKNHPSFVNISPTVVNGRYYGKVFKITSYSTYGFFFFFFKASIEF